MKLPIHVVNAFTYGPFTGNPAAVVPTSEPLPDDLMQQIAAQNNLAETAFVVTGEEPYPLRWFTPTKEVDLCGHATLATAAVLFRDGYVSEPVIRFSSKSGELRVSSEGELLQLDFPARPAEKIAQPDREAMANALGCKPNNIDTALDGRFLAVVLKDTVTVGRLQPNLSHIATLHHRAVAATAPGVELDFVARFFAPNMGINEDPVTGSAYTLLAPYWAERLGRDTLQARQMSGRGGELRCQVKGERILIAGQTCHYLSGEIDV